ncbi:enoyl-CoA hydratase/isomerase family protein [Nocardioides euryhalodurans]|uniref:Enoyl-CoA hydratase n=1 Tax=Nocardioides euryhalodurans TaxID=2518370 RepID=A0A4P7GL45_9ACTN|nr:enoyl-CoA hydratase/isomerase family protein [Nocardioides euryhalodurans]QBR92848.1 enoyl-CoA hydratase [Nocardioides euryhalodurans]
MSDQLLTERRGDILLVTFNRPEAHNAMTWEMYDGLVAACEAADADDEVRSMVLHGAGGKAFIAGTDIAQFREFSSGADGVAYEERIAAVTDRLERVRKPTVAAIDGYCIGGGLVIASVCDLRIATTTAKFGAPIARTLGNCLSMNTYSLLVHHLGPARTLDMLLRGRSIDAASALAAGFVSEVCESDELDARVTETTDVLASHAPLTMWATKEAVRRLRTASIPDGDDIVSTVFGSEDFRHGVASFMAKQKPTWSGR